jgi:hypothetical protein
MDPKSKLENEHVTKEKKYKLKAPSLALCDRIGMEDMHSHQ